MISTVAVTLWYLPKYYDNPMLSCLFQNSDQHSLKSVPKTLIYSDCWWPYFEVNFVNKYKFIHWECFQTFVWRLIKKQIVGMQRNQRDHFFYNINLKNIRVSSHRMQSRFYFSKLFNISWDHIQYILLSDNGVSQRLRRLFSFLINFN